MKKNNSPSPAPGKGRRLWISAGVILVLLAVWITANLGSEEAASTAYHEVKRGSFLVTIVEGGTLEAVREDVIRNEVEGNSRIIYIVPEGSYVTNGQLLVELDTGEAEDAVNQQEINYEKAKSAFILAEKDLEIQRSVIQSTIDAADLKMEFAGIDLEKFKKGDLVKELRNAEIGIATETSKLLLAKDSLEWSEKLYEQGFETKNVVDKERTALQELQLKVESAQTNLWVLTTFEHPKMLRQYQSDLDEAKKELDRTIAQGEGKLSQLEADLITQSNSLVLIKRKLENDKLQLEKSKIYAPQDGLVVYAETRSRFSSQTMIEEGAQVRQRQELIKLPDATEMKVEINIHESHVSKVRPGLGAFVVLDPMPDKRFPAVVTKVAVLPDTQSRFGNPNLKVYKTEVKIREKLNDIKPGVSARAEIVITNIPNTITVPIQAVTTLKGQTVAFVRRGGDDAAVPVDVGMFNNKSIEILSGLAEGDQVLLSPPFDAEEKDLDGAIIDGDDNIPPPTPGPENPAPGRGSQGPAAPDMTRTTPDSQGDERGSEKRPGSNREQMMKRFDKNGDGTLDEQEREAVRAAFGGGRPPGGGGGGGPDRRRQGGGGPSGPSGASGQP